jgi:exonuclease III
MWNLCSSGSLKTVAKQLAKYKLDLLGVQEVKLDKGGIETAEDYTFFYGNGNADHHIGTGFSCM